MEITEVEEMVAGTAQWETVSAHTIPDPGIRLIPADIILLTLTTIPFTLSTTHNT